MDRVMAPNQTKSYTPDQVFWASAIGLMTLIWLINSGVTISAQLSEGRAVNYKYPLVGEFTGVYTVLLLMPLLLGFFKMFPLTRAGWPRVVPLYLLVLVIFGLSHTSLMIVSRKAIYAAAGWGPYQPGILTYRYLMEFQKQIGVFGIILILHAFMRYIHTNQQRRLQTIQLQEQLTRARLQALKLQLDPHFLFNTLNTISATMYEDVSAADVMITRLSDLLRLTLSTGEKQRAAFEAELAIIDTYLSIMHARFGDKLAVAMDIDPQSKALLFPVLTLQPLVENSVKHGLTDGDRQVRIFIHASVAAGQLTVTIEDNGPGLGRATNPKDTKRTGLRATRERLASLYGEAHTFTMENRRQGGLRTKITVPAQATGTTQAPTRETSEK